jgi:23S rRNA pseudouridine2605 synthase
MRLNKYIAQFSEHSRRQADQLIIDGRVSVNGKAARLGQSLSDTDKVEVDAQPLNKTAYIYVLLNKPIGYVCSRHGQGAATIFELLPTKFKQLNSAGRLDKDTSGLILLSNDGDFIQSLTHPSQAQPKIYHLSLERPLQKADWQKLLNGLKLPDGISRFDLVNDLGDNRYEVTLHGGRNRQIRRSLEALGYDVTALKRLKFGPYALNGLKSCEFKEVEKR